MREVVVTGIGSTPFGKLEGRRIESLAIEAANAALHRAGLDRKSVGAVYLGNFVAGPLSGQEVLAGIVADELGLENVPCTKVEGACASGGIAFRHAVLAVSSGLCDAALVVGVEKMTHATGGQVTQALNCAMDNRSDGPSGLTFPGLFGLAWRIHAAKYGTTRDEVSAVVIKNKANGLKNPLAQMGASLSLDVIRQSQMIADPLQLYDCCPVSDGAAALVVVAKDRARGAPDLPIDILAAVQTRGSARIAGHEDVVSFEATVKAAERAYAAASVGPKDIDFVELHDCFSMAEVIDSEDLGLVPRGEGAKWAAQGRTGMDGDIPINPSGGLLAKGHPVGATGVGQLYETVLQLRGQHSNQVKDAAIGMTHNLGGTGVACTVSILRRPDA
ncbi:MAG: acetyl-CoA C-acetyltransferase [Alphaproteobacteria bacterium]|jgi:acetyl-CoA C-acetyltransferase|nr:acetyl-CoA C-acetyltransferase [Alphaproteobacteria bacterium]